MKQMNSKPIRFPAEIHHKLKIEAARAGVTMGEYVIRLMTMADMPQKRKPETKIRK
jgi:hypothetical protein